MAKDFPLRLPPNQAPGVRKQTAGAVSAATPVTESFRFPLRHSLLRLAQVFRAGATSRFPLFLRHPGVIVTNLRSASWASARSNRTRQLAGLSPSCAASGGARVAQNIKVTHLIKSSTADSQCFKHIRVCSGGHPGAHRAPPNRIGRYAVEFTHTPSPTTGQRDAETLLEPKTARPPGAIPHGALTTGQTTR